MSSWKIKLLKALKSQSNQSCVNRTESGQSDGKCAKIFIRLHYNSVYLKELHNSDTTTKNTNLACENRGTQRQFSGKYLFGRRFEIWNFRSNCCKISYLPASPRIFEHLKNGIFTHFQGILTLKKAT